MKNSFLITALFLFGTISPGSTAAPETGQNRIRLNDSLTLIEQDGKHRLVHSGGKAVWPGFYDYISVLEDRNAIVCRDGKWGYATRLNGREPELTYDHISRFQEGLAMVRLRDKWGYMDRSGDMVIGIRFENAGLFGEGLAGVRDPETKKYGYIDRSGELAVPFRYDYGWSFNHGIARIKTGDFFGLIDTAGHLLFDTLFYRIDEPYRGYYMLSTEGKKGVVNREGKQIIPVLYDKVVLVEEDNLFKVWNGEVCGLIDTTGKALTPVVYSHIGPFRDSVAMVSVHDRFGFIDRNGDVIVSPQYDAVSFFENGLAAVKSGDKYGIVDRNGTCRIPPLYDHFRPKDQMVWIPLRWETISRWDENYKSYESLKFDGLDLPDDYAVVISDYDYAMLDRNGNQITPLKYDHFEYFTEGLAIVALNGKLGYIDTTGREVIPLEYDFGSPFHNGLARVRRQGRMGLIDNQNRPIVQFRYDYIYKIKYGMGVTRLDGTFGLVDTAGNEIVPPVYDNIFDIQEGISITRMGDKYGFIVTRPFREIEPKYDEAFNGYTTHHGEALNFHNDWKKVKRGELVNYVDTLGVEMFPFRYTDIRAEYPLNSGRFSVTADGKRGLIQMDGIDTVSHNPDRPHGGEWTELIPVEHASLQKITDSIYTAVYQKKSRIWNIASGRYIQTPYDQLSKLMGNNTQYNLLKARKKKKYGVIDLHGNTILPPIYQNVRHMPDSDPIRISLESNDKFGLADTLGNILVPPVYTWIRQESGFYLLRKNDCYGLADADGKMLLDPIYPSLVVVNDNALIVDYGNHLYGLIDMHGNPLTDSTYREVRKTNENLRYRDHSGKSGLMDHQGNILMTDLGNSFSYRESLSDILYRKGYLTDDDGNLSGPHNQVILKHSVSFRRQQNDTYFLPGPLSGEGWDEENFIVCSDNKKYGLYEPESGRFITPMIYDYLKPRGIHAVVGLDGRHGTVSGYGDEIIPPQYGNEISFSEGLARVVTDTSGVGFIGYTGELGFPHRFPDAGDMKGGRIVVCVDGLWGAIDRDGETVIPPQYEYLSNFADNRAIFQAADGNYGVVDREGNVIIAPHYSSIERAGGVFICRTDEGYGLVDQEGRLLIEPQFERIVRRTFYDPDDYYRHINPDRQEFLFVTEKDGKFGIVTPDGRETIRPKYASRPETPRYNLEIYYSGPERFFTVGYTDYVITRDGRELDLKEYDRLTVERDTDTGLPFFTGRKGDRYYLIDFYGKEVPFPEHCLPSGAWKDNLCQIKTERWLAEDTRYNEQYGYIDRQGAIVVPPCYERNNMKYHAESQVFEVSRRDKTGLIHRDGTVIAETIYDAVQFPYTGGVCDIEERGQFGLCRPLRGNLPQLFRTETGVQSPPHLRKF